MRSKLLDSMLCLGQNLIVNMHQLKLLDLSQNKLSRQIPPQLAKHTFLEFLNLSNDQLVKYSDFDISKSLVYR
ncbi:hypothetical protein COP2_033813 [Malus domestica]